MLDNLVSIEFPALVDLPGKTHAERKAERVAQSGYVSTLGPHVKLDLDSDVPLPAGQACGLAPGECEACQ